MLGLALAAALSAGPVTTSRGDQPLVLYKPAAPSDRPLVLMLSGEGGWRAFDDKIATWLAAEGYTVGGVDCMRYFREPQDDRETLAGDARRFADALVAAAGKKVPARVVLLGYSFGADLAPWIAGAKARDPRIAGLVLIGPDRTGSLEFRVSEMLGFHPTDHVFDTAGALADVADLPVLFVHGGDDDGSDAVALAKSFPGRGRLVVVPGGSHHFSGQDDALRAALAEGLASLLPR